MGKKCETCYHFHVTYNANGPCMACRGHSNWRSQVIGQEPELVSSNDYHAKKQDQGKPDMRMLRYLKHSLIAIVGIMQAGAIKYEEGSFVNVPEGLKRYDSALMRHWLEDPGSPVDDMQEYADQLGIEITHDMAVAINALFKLEIRLRKEAANDN